jgi:hypothetical protein
MLVCLRAKAFPRPDRLSRRFAAFVYHSTRPANRSPLFRPDGRMSLHSRSAMGRRCPLLESEPRHSFPDPLGWYAVATTGSSMRASCSREIFRRGVDPLPNGGWRARLTVPIARTWGYLGSGKVVGENLRCAFHGFGFGGDGRCVRTAYGKRCRARLSSAPGDPSAAGIFAWYHEGKQPD